MQFSEDNNLDGNIIRAYHANKIQINETWFEHSLIVTATEIIDSWPPKTINELTLEHWQTVIDLHPEIVLLGSGQNLQFPARHFLQLLQQKSIGVEVMDTMAACRTYNILMSEGRQVAAALLLPETHNPLK